MSKKQILPKFETEERREAFFNAYSKERFLDERKHYFTESELNELARESSVSGGEMLSLDDILKQVTVLLKKGNEEALMIEIPQTAGTDALKEVRKVDDLKVRRGYEKIEEAVFGFVDDEEETMRYFNEKCEEVVERERPLSAKEKREYLGLFASVNVVNKLSEEEFLKTGTDDSF